MKCHCPWGPKIESLLLLNPWEWKVFWSDHLRRRNAKQKLLLSYMSLVNKKLRTMIQQPFSTLLKSTPNSLVTEFFSCSWLYNFFFFFNFTILYWFGHISTWIHHRYTRVPHPEPSSLLPPRTSLGSPQCTSPKHPVSCIEPGLAATLDTGNSYWPFPPLLPPG